MMTAGDFVHDETAAYADLASWEARQQGTRRALLLFRLDVT